jgi:hypothetical protein
VNALILRDARLDDAEDVARFTREELATASSKPLAPKGHSLHVHKLEGAGGWSTT